LALLDIVVRPASISVRPGGEASCTVTIRNRSDVVQRVLIEVIGEAAPWSVADRDGVALLPGQEADAAVVLRPPGDPSSRAGGVSFAVKVTPKDAPDDSVVAAADVVVLPFHATTATIAPAVASGYRRGRQTVTVRNGGNTPVPIEISAEDPDLLLEIDVSPSTLLLDPGDAGRARVVARGLADSGAAAGGPHGYRVSVRAGDEPPLELEGAVRLRRAPLGLIGSIVCVLVVLGVAVSLLVGRDGTAPAAQPGRSTTSSVQTTPTSATPSSVTPTTLGTATTVVPTGAAAAIAMGAECRTTGDLRVNGRVLGNPDRTFARTFTDEGTAIAGRNLLIRHPMVCTIGNPAADDSVLTFHPPPADPTLEVPGSRCSARYAPASLGKSKTPDNALFVVEVGPNQFLFYQKEVDRDRAFALLRGHNQICWLGGGAEDLFGAFFNWAGALTYF
jgi:hypothetical protein